MKNKLQTTIKDLDKIIKLKNKGLSLREIGAIVSLNYQTVKNILDKYNKNGN